ncbi:MAG: glycine--tRNA ligase [Phycisphaerales bacterium]|nr:MAG: glycine--tRNA ligase [Phycisphaerales bacterium]
MKKDAQTMEKIVALCRRRGFIFGSSEIYGGIGGFWDYGPLGCELKRNIKDAWWHDCVRNPPVGPDGREYQMVGVDCSIIMNPKVWEASGHVGGFSDPMVDCKACKRRFRADQLWTVEVFSRGFFDTSHFDASFTDRSIGLLPTVEYHPGTAIQGEPGWIASGLFDSSRSALDSVEELVRKSSRYNKIASLKSFEITDRSPKGMLGLFKGKDGDGREYQGVVGYLDALPFSVNSVRPRPCPECFGELTESRAFNLMFQTYVGALQDPASMAYLRPETAQGIFANFQNVYDTSRVKIPFGIAQIGKAFRNEINPRNYIFRSREFEQMEIEFFCHPDESMMWYEFWRDARIDWYKSLGIASERLRPRQQGKDELAHYSSACTDIEYLFPFSEEPQELEGVAHRGDFDLRAHGKGSKNKEDAFAVFDDEAWERDKDKFTAEGAEGAEKAKLAERAKEAKSRPPYRYVPHVIEPSAGADRFTLAVLCEAYSFDESRASPEFLKFHPRLAPIKAAVFPLVAKDGLPEVAMPIYEAIRKVMPCQYDAKQSIGKRYARMDEAGTPFCFTIDGQTKEDGTVTVRNRDDAGQQRIDKSRCLEYLRQKLGL